MAPWSSSHLSLTRFVVQRRSDAVVKRNADIAEDRRIAFQVGVNVGDIIIDDHDISREGRNVTGRLETLAGLDSIRIRRAARDQVRNRPELALEDMGEQPVNRQDAIR